MPKVLVYSKANCPFCDNAKELLKSRNVAFEEIRVDLDHDKLEEMLRLSNRRTVPQIFVDDKSIGGFDELAALVKTGEFDKLFNQ